MADNNETAPPVSASDRGRALIQGLVSGAILAEKRVVELEAENRRLRAGIGLPAAIMPQDMLDRLRRALNDRHMAKFWAGGVDNDADVIELRAIFDMIKCLFRNVPVEDVAAVLEWPEVLPSALAARVRELEAEVARLRAIVNADPTTQDMRLALLRMPPEHRRPLLEMQARLLVAEEANERMRERLTWIAAVSTRPAVTDWARTHLPPEQAQMTAEQQAIFANMVCPLTGDLQSIGRWAQEALNGLCEGAEKEETDV